eukprot:scaffold532872_cov46-Prasinocladus_malaysianus.AAC.2
MQACRLHLCQVVHFYGGPGVTEGWVLSQVGHHGIRPAFHGSNDYQARSAAPRGNLSADWLLPGPYCCHVHEQPCCSEHGCSCLYHINGQKHIETSERYCGFIWLVAIRVLVRARPGVSKEKYAVKLAKPNKPRFAEKGYVGYVINSASGMFPTTKGSDIYLVAARAVTVILLTT